jgi:ribosomal protein S18 acetylase RimI-like enzyme
LHEILTDDDPQLHAIAIERNIIEQYAFIFSSWPRFELRRTEDLVWYTSGIAHPSLNHILLAKLNPETVDLDIDEILAEFTSRRVPVTWSIGPSSRPGNLSVYLTRCGLTYLKDEIGMAMDLATVKSDQIDLSVLKIQQVHHEEMLREWFQPVSVSFGYPQNVATVLYDLYSKIGFDETVPWQLFVGYLRGKPVGAARVFFGAGVAGIYHVATVPEVRGQGIGTAMTLTSLRAARNRGYRIGVLRAAEEALGLYRRLGFREYCPFHFYIWPGRRHHASFSQKKC